MKLPTRAVIASLFAACLTLVATRVRADAPAADKAAAQALFEQGLKLMTAGDATHACPKLEESQRLDPAMGTLFRLSECWEAIGRTASAWAAYVEVAELARASAQTDRERVARERAARLEPSLCYVEIDVPPSAPAGLEVRRDGVVVGAGQFGTRIPVDPGAVRITATAPGRQTWSTVATASTGAPVVVHVPELAAMKAEPAVEAPSEPAPTSTPRIVGGVLFGVGAASIVASGVLGLVALSKYDSAGDHCAGSVCDADGKRITDGARTTGNVATVVFGVGAALAVGGAIVWLSYPTPSAPARAARRLRLTPGGAFFEAGF